MKKLGFVLLLAALTLSVMFWTGCTAFNNYFYDCPITATAKLFDLPIFTLATPTKPTTPLPQYGVPPK